MDNVLWSKLAVFALVVIVIACMIFRKSKAPKRAKQPGICQQDETSESVTSSVNQSKAKRLNRMSFGLAKSRLRRIQSLNLVNAVHLERILSEWEKAVNDPRSDLDLLMRFNATWKEKASATAIAQQAKFEHLKMLEAALKGMKKMIDAERFDMAEVIESFKTWLAYAIQGTIDPVELKRLRNRYVSAVEEAFRLRTKFWSLWARVMGNVNIADRMFKGDDEYAKLITTIHNRAQETLTVNENEGRFHQSIQVLQDCQAKLNEAIDSRREESVTIFDKRGLTFRLRHLQNWLAKSTMISPDHQKISQLIDDATGLLNEDTELAARKILLAERMADLSTPPEKI